MDNFIYQYLFDEINCSVLHILTASLGSTRELEGDNDCLPMLRGEDRGGVGVLVHVLMKADFSVFLTRPCVSHLSWTAYRSPRNTKTQLMPMLLVTL